ncbi:MAG: deoxyribonuclease V [Deltaproteobacteria bacterium]|nr:deoxyribonuclease V [Deltaproteobacteria bacterium]
MKGIVLPEWPRDTVRAREVQIALQKKIVIKPLRKLPELIAGVDAAFFENKIIGIASLYRYSDLTPLKDSVSIREVTFPYIPGLLSFREGPVVIEAIKGLETVPDLILFDGQGIAHPRGVGIASHIGVLLGIPSIGCAKSRLVGDYCEPGAKKGSSSPLRYKGKIVGSVVRSRDNVRPLFVSPGHLVDIDGAVEYVLACTGRYRLPEPIRRADRLSKDRSLRP